jgi:hypothetical protein
MRRTHPYLTGASGRVVSVYCGQQRSLPYARRLSLRCTASTGPGLHRLRQCTASSKRSMQVPNVQDRSVHLAVSVANMRTRIALWMLVVTLVVCTAPLLTADDDFGTIGIRFEQLYDDAQPGKHGPLIVLDVVEGLSGAKAGVHKGDIVFAIDGALVIGRDLDEIIRKAIRGPVGSTVRLSFVRLDGSQYELTLPRMPYPPQINPASDPFAYSIPGSWRIDPRYTFPLTWAPSIAYHGVEDVAFSPDFDYVDSPEYHSYLFFWWLEGTVPRNAKQLEADMVTYFRGIAEQRGRNHGFNPDPSQIVASYNSDPSGVHALGVPLPPASRVWSASTTPTARSSG